MSQTASIILIQYQAISYYLEIPKIILGYLSRPWQLDLNCLKILKYASNNIDQSQSISKSNYAILQSTLSGDAVGSDV